MGLFVLLVACDGDPGDSSDDSERGDSGDTGELPPLERELGDAVLGGDFWTGDEGDGLGAVTRVGEEHWLSAAQRNGGDGAVCLATDTGPTEPCWTGRTSRSFLGNTIATYDGSVAAGAFWDSSQGSWAGAVFLLDDAGGSVDDAPVIWEGASGDYAGSSLSVGDLDGDGQDDLAVGGFAAGASSNGRLWIVGREGGDLDGAGSIVKGPVADGWFGIDSAIGDVDGDGQDDLLVGAFGENDEAGAAYLFLGPIEGTVTDHDVRVHGETRFGYGGKSVALGDIDGDGLADLVVAESDVDRVHVVLAPQGSAPLSESDATITGSGRFGFALDSDDLDRDGFDDIAVGSTRFEDTGAAFVFYGPVSGEQTHEDADWTLTGEAVDDKAGVEVQLFDNQLFVGASGPESGAGRVYRP